MTMKFGNLPYPEKLILAGSVLAFLAGSLFHYLYEISGNSVLMGALAPVNESIWEHLKMIPIPLTAWWLLSYRLALRRGAVDRDKWFTGAPASIAIALITVPAIYYFYTGAFTDRILIVDISSLFVGFLFGQLLARHLYKHAAGIDARLALALCLAIIALFAWFTFNTPHLPLFADPIDGSFGL